MKKIKNNYRFSDCGGFPINPRADRHFQLNTPLTDICESLESFAEFSLETRRAAITLRAAELGVAEIHFYLIAAHLVEMESVTA